MQRSKSGSVVKDKRSKVWNFYWWENGKRRSKQLGCFSTKTAAWQAAQTLRISEPAAAVATVRTLVAQYEAEKMPQRYSTRRAYKLWLKNYVLPVWGDKPITELQPRPVERWLCSLELSPKSRSHVRGMMRMVWEYAMWSGALPVQVNPISLVTVPGSSKRTRKPRSLTVEEFQKLSEHLTGPFKIMALVSVCCGLRISECLGLRWADVDWLGGSLTIRRGIVRNREGDVKTENSARAMSLDAAMLEVLKGWKQVAPFSETEDWVFGSIAMHGRKPWSSDQVWRMYLRAAQAAGIGRVGTHTMRHTYRSWLDAVGTPIALQQKLMRHADIRTTMNVYGDVFPDAAAEASGKVTRLALNGRETAGKPS